MLLNWALVCCYRTMCLRLGLRRTRASPWSRPWCWSIPGFVRSRLPSKDWLKNPFV